MALSAWRRRRLRARNFCDIAPIFPPHGRTAPEGKNAVGEERPATPLRLLAAAAARLTFPKLIGVSARGEAKEKKPRTKLSRTLQLQSSDREGRVKGVREYGEPPRREAPGAGRSCRVRDADFSRRAQRESDRGPLRPAGAQPVSQGAIRPLGTPARWGSSAHWPVASKQAFAEHAGWPWMTPTKKRLRDPSVFDGARISQEHSGVSFLKADFPAREGEAPVTHDVCPHGMLTQQTPDHLFPLFIAMAAERMGRRAGVVVTERSVVSLQTTAPCFCLDKAYPLPRGLAQTAHAREFAHIHAPYNPEFGWSAKQGGGAGSQHTTLAPADCRRLVQLGWAEWHPVAHAGHPLVMVYGPRNDVEMELCLHVLDAAADFFVHESGM